MPRPPKSDRDNLRAVRPTGSRAVLSLPGVGAAIPLGPTAAEIGRPEIQRSQGQSDGEDDGSAVVTLRYTSPLMPYVKQSDWVEFNKLALRLKSTAEALSKGPYTLRMLRAMGHPYAKNPKDVSRIVKLRETGHNVPRFQPNKAIGHIKGIRGSVTTLSVANIQTGNFAESWTVEVVIDAAGVTVKLVNSAEYAWFLMDGTKNMLAHGPFEYVVRLLLPPFNAAWAQIVTQADRRRPKTKAARAARMA